MTTTSTTPSYFDRSQSPTLSNPHSQPSPSVAAASTSPAPPPVTAAAAAAQSTNRTSDASTLRTFVSNASSHTPSSSANGNGTITNTISSSRRPKIAVVPPFARNDTVEMPEDEEYSDDDFVDTNAAAGGSASGRRRSGVPSSGGRPSGEVSLIAGSAGPGRSDHDRNGGGGAGNANGSSDKSSPTRVDDDGSPAGLARPQPAADPNATVRRSGAGAGQAGTTSDGETKWWTFTIPAKYRSRLEGYVHPDEDAGGGGGDGYVWQQNGDPEKEAMKLEEARQAREQGQGQEMRQRRPLGLRRNTGEKQGVDGFSAVRAGREPGGPGGMKMDVAIPSFEPLSLNQAQTPGWSAPWTPFKKTRTDIDLEALRPGSPRGSSKDRAPGVIRNVQNFLLHNPFAPLVLRVLNCGFTTTTLALAIRIRLVEQRNDLYGVVGSSTTYAIVVSPLTLVHVLSNVYFEYFGKPIGIWSVRTKMVHTLVELLFICLWSAELSLAADDLFTTPLACTSWTPNGRFRDPGNLVPDATREGTTADLLCDYQASLLGLTFVSVWLYTSVLITSLFRIFNKVSRKA